MKELWKGKTFILFLVFVLGIFCIQKEQIKMDSYQENNSIMMNA